MEYKITSVDLNFNREGKLWIDWIVEDYGFGSIHFYPIPDNKWAIDSEEMSNEFVKALFGYIIDNSVEAKEYFEW